MTRVGEIKNNIMHEFFGPTWKTKAKEQTEPLWSREQQKNNQATQKKEGTFSDFPHSSPKQKCKGVHQKMPCKKNVSECKKRDKIMFHFWQNKLASGGFSLQNATVIELDYLV